VVYKAKSRSTEQVVAIKKTKLDVKYSSFLIILIFKKLLNEGIPTTTLREVSLLRELNHPNIVT